MKYLVSIIGCLLFLSVVDVAYADYVVPRDSIGTEKVNGKVVVLHKVDKGQTMYSLMRRYKTTIKAIKDLNPGIEDQLKSDQIVRVPYEGKVAKPVTLPATTNQPATTKPNSPSKPLPTEAPSAGTHKVEAGQTLYSIAIRYGVLMADIRKWNSLTSDNVPLGQTLIVSEKAFLEKNRKGVSPPVNLNTDSSKATTAATERVVKPAAESIPAKPMTGKPVKESGLAEVIETSESSNKFLALHRSAPIGTLIHVRNVYNQEEIYVKVVGRIPNTSVNEDILIKLSLRAFERISPNSKRFRAELNYKIAN